MWRGARRRSRPCYIRVPPVPSRLATGKCGARFLSGAENSRQPWPPVSEARLAGAFFPRYSCGGAIGLISGIESRRYRQSAFGLRWPPIPHKRARARSGAHVHAYIAVDIVRER